MGPIIKKKAMLKGKVDLIFKKTIKKYDWIFMLKLVWDCENFY